MITAVDTNILLDVLIPNSSYLKSSLNKLEIASQKGKIIICEIVYAELASQFERVEDLHEFLQDSSIEIHWSIKDTLIEAGTLWARYLFQKKKRFFCPECGKSIKLTCPRCGKGIQGPRRILSDFIIGSHAKAFANVFLTRDRGFYRHYFKDVRIW